MRKASSAPCLASLGEQQPPVPRSIPKSGSSGAVSSLKPAGGSHPQKDAGLLRRQGSVPARLRGCKPRAFPLAVVDVGMPPPPDPDLQEEFAESARGLAGLECYELYGPQRDAPALQASTRTVSNEQQYDRKAAFASCLATPLTGEDKNLGELVDSQAREMMQAAQQSIEARFQREVAGETGELIEQAVGLKREDDEMVLVRRKRRLAEKMGLDSHGGKRNGVSRLFEDNPEAETLLSNMASLDDDQNRMHANEDLLCVGDVCFPVEEVEESIFFSPPRPRALGSDIRPAEAISQSI